VTGNLPAGVYESLRTAGLEASLEGALLRPRFENIDSTVAPDVLSRHIADVVRRALVETADEGARIRLVNELLALLESPEDQLTERLEQLVALTREVAPGVHAVVRPLTPLSQAALMTNAPEEPGLGAELRTELASADRVDLLCAFIRWHGLRVLEQQLLEVAEKGVPFRVITTTYIGATEKRAIDELVRRFGAEVRITYETQSTRLHAKAWLFRRESGFDTAFVGSSNLSRAALVDGLEWNVRLSGIATPDLIRKFAATFDTYWNDSAFETYNPDTDGDKLAAALARAGSGTTGSRTLSLSGLTVRPFPHQEQILEALESEREVHGRHSNLVVAATGTGKTVVAALDYRRLASAVAGGRPTLLFVAHRKEILQQSLRTYREVLADGAFGELYVGGERPEQWRHVFASIQSLSAYGPEHIPADHFDIVVIDEFHHAEASTYQRLLHHIQPRELLGLTATPERADGVDVRQFFDGRTAYEIRLWDALADDLLVPFHYFGLADDTDLSGIEWKRGAYDIVGLDKVYTGNDARTAKVLREVIDKVTDVHTMHALGFCVSVAHAHYMARKFNEAGIRALAVSGETPSVERADSLQQLRDGTVNILFAADLFNEGLDLPMVDTVLFLRPTQSATVFLQQLGRGLRRDAGKAVLTVLDFIGQHRKEYRFDTRFRALTGSTRAALERDIEKGFPFLPSGSQIVLDRVAKQIVLENVRHQLRLNRGALAVDLRSYGDISLGDYLEQSGRELADIYRNNGSWTALRRAAGLPTLPEGPDEEALLKRISTLIHVDDRERANAYIELMSDEAPPYDELSERQQILARMLFFTVWPSKSHFESWEDGFAHLRRHPAACAELRDVMELRVDRARLVPRSLGEGMQQAPILSHAHYRREEILAGIGWASWDRMVRGQATGVAWAQESGIDALMINLRKSERDFSPSTMYRDYAVSPELFHWESQNATRIASPTGERYLNHEERGSHVVLFARESPSDDIGAAPFLCLGAATFVEHRGERPISITWRLHRAMPGETFHIASVVAR